MLCVELFERDTVVFEATASAPLEIGRRDLARQEPAPFQLISNEGHQRLIIVDAGRNLISRRHLTIEELSPDRLQLKNETSNSLLLCGSEADLQPLQPQHSCEVLLPTTIVFPDDLRLQLRSEATELQGLRNVTRAPGSKPSRESAAALQQTMTPAAIVNHDGFFAESLLLLLGRLGDGLQLQTEAIEAECFAAEQLQTLLGMSAARMVPYQNGWPANRTDSEAVVAQPPAEILEHVAASRRTMWKRRRELAIARSGPGVLMIAAPVLSASGDLRGALYAEAIGRGPKESAANDRATAQLVEFVATSLAATLARIQQQKEVERRTTLFQQFFGTALSQELDRQPDLLNGRDADVSILFCDLRGFSRFSEALGTAATFEWIQSVMTALTQCVADEEGVLLDYVGDELIAMWGAPSPREDHADRAIRAGQQMLARLPQLNDLWQHRLGARFSLGIGINSGPVRVGNIGSEQKFKYGPLGNTVNVASRIQGLNKQFGTRLLISEATEARRQTPCPTRRLGLFRVVGIDQPVQLHEVPEPESPPEWSQLQTAYQKALGHFERGEFTSVLELLSVALRIAVNDRPSLLLLSRAATALSQGQTSDHPVWSITEK
ncbi:diguanylate cyclase [bacterium]|nr:diguanylate cyclase [bacterium]